MSDQKAVLFIGGPCDGEIRALPFFSSTYQVGVNIGMKVETEVYELETLRADPENDFRVYRHKDLTNRQALELLLVNYRPEKKQP